MDRPLIVAGPGDDACARAVAERIGGEIAATTIRQFPDSEIYLRIDTPVAGRTVWVVCTLHPAGEKILPVYFLASTARDLGARAVYLAAPYLAYLRQDSRFHEGEGITSLYVARLLSSVFDGIVTVDPHLHRYQALGEVYSIPSEVVHAAPRIAEWIRAEVDNPVIIGPDAESEQWVRAVAAEIGCPMLILHKVRRGDRDVSISPVDAAIESGLHIAWMAVTPVLVDDIVSTARTMIETIVELRRVAPPPPVCIGVHAVFADGAYEDLCAAGVARVVTCNTIGHDSNAIDVHDLVADAVHRFST
jgi:ribose-phosphate pyrophosphokinase